MAWENARSDFGCAALPTSAAHRYGRRSVGPIGLRGDKTALPQASTVRLSIILIGPEPTLGTRLEIERPAFAHQPLVQTEGFPVDPTGGELSTPIRSIGCRVL